MHMIFLEGSILVPVFSHARRIPLHLHILLPLTYLHSQPNFDSLLQGVLLSDQHIYAER